MELGARRNAAERRAGGGYQLVARRPRFASSVAGGWWQGELGKVEAAGAPLLLFTGHALRGCGRGYDTPAR